MGSFTSEFKVGLLTLVMGGVLAFFVLSTRDAPFGPGHSYVLYTVAPTAEGLGYGNAIQMAGVKVGRVSDITLDKGQARMTLELNADVKLPVDSKVTVKTQGMLGDKYIALLPGTKSEVLAPESSVAYVVPEGDLDQLTKKLSDVAGDVKDVTADLKVISGSLRETMGDGKLTGSVEQILKNLEVFTGTLKQLGGTNREDLDSIVRNIRDVSQGLKDLLGSSQTVLEGSSKQVTDQISSLQAATARLDDVLANINKIAEKVNTGEGTVGSLLNDSSTVDNINEAVSSASDLLDRVNRFKTSVSLTGDYYALAEDGLQGGMKTSLTVTLANRKDYYYTLALVSDPVLDSTLKIVKSDNPLYDRQERVYTDAYQFTAQFARRWRDLALRIGVKENHGGLGADYFFWKDRFALSADVYDFASKARPNIELRARMGVYNHLYVSAGLDDIWNRSVNPDVNGPLNLFVGAGFSFQDDDLKFLLSYIPIPK